MGWFDDNAPDQEDWFSANAPSPTPAGLRDDVSPLPRDEGDGFLAQINRALGIQDYREPLPEVPGEENLVAPKPWRNFEEATRENIQGMLPHDIPSYLRSIAGPAGHAYEQAKAIAGGDVGSVRLVGRVPELIAAEDTPAFSKERIGTAERVLMDLGALAGAGEGRVRAPTLAERITSPRVEPPVVPPETPPAPAAEPPPPGAGAPVEQPSRAGPPPVAEPATPPVPTQLSPAERNAQILERRKGILARKAELNARAAGGEQGLEAQLAAVEAELNDPVTNPVVHAPPVEVPVRHGEFAKPGYTAVETPPGAGAPVEQPSRAGPTPEIAIPEADRPYAGEPPPAAPPPQTPPAGVSKIGQSIEAKAVETKLTKGFPETAGYNPLTIKDQAARASSVVEESPAHARAIVRGEAPLPPELRGTSLITAMEEHLLRNPDAQVAYELANSKLVSLTSEAAQEMRLMSERVPDGITTKFAEIKAAREAGAKLRGETPAKVKADITKEVVRQASKRPTWEQFVGEIVC